ncbi:MAG: hypothetical protein ACXW31_14245 [Thermoanaerobaculia bacterium]
MTRQVFWTYASYIMGIHVAFGLLSLLAPGALLDGSLLARSVCGFIAVYWLVRLTLQFVAFDRSVAAGRPLFRFAEAAYVSVRVSRAGVRRDGGAMNIEAPIVRMLVLIAVTFVAMKITVVAMTKTRLTRLQWLAYLGWFGMPTLYFLLHGVLVGLERRFPCLASRAWTLFWLVAPLPILFHPPFLRGVVWPLVSSPT